MDHICHVDCKPEINPINGHTIHIMYPNWTRSNYGPQNHTRRSWRETGQDQSRNCRLWDFEHGYVK